MNAKDDVTDQIIEHLRMLCPEQDIQINDRLYHDLEIDIEDAAELFEFMSRRFGVEVSGIDLTRYFPRYVSTIRRLLEAGRLIPKKGKIEIRVSDLVNFAVGDKSALP